MIRLSGLFTIVPATMLLTISFFVLFAAEKAASEGIKKLGRAAAALLWICAGLVLLVGIYILATGHHPLITVIGEACKSCPLQR